MFNKSYKLKSNNTLKNSEKKQLAQRIRDEFPAATEEAVRALVPAKASCVCSRLVLHSGEALSVLAVDGAPLLLDSAAGLVPTVCALWRAPCLLPALVVHDAVLPKVAGGAPLYLPGVVLPPGGAGFPQFARGALLAARTQSNAAAALVGRAAMCSGDMLLRVAGVCLETVHVFGDLLCKDPRYSKVERPLLSPESCASARAALTETLAADIVQLHLRPAEDEWPSLGPPPSAPAPNQPRLIAEPPPPPAGEPAGGAADAAGERAADTDQRSAPLATDEEGMPSDMDGLLQWCLLSFLKLEAKSVELPLKISLLYRNHLVPLCPPGRALDVKKSSYKKMSKFLEAMQTEGLVEVREVERGVDALVAVSAQHPRLRAHRVPDALRERARAPRPFAPAYEPPQVREMLCVTAHVLDVLAPAKKGTALTAAEVRGALTEYVRARALTPAHAHGAVQLDVPLARAAGAQPQELMKWDALMAAVRARMTPATEMRFADGSLRLSKARLEPVRMQLATRSGNKKVTLVSNLEAFGFSLPALAHACQLGAGAACGVTRSAGARSDQLLLQGDQSQFVARLLVERYGLPKKYLDGADKALSKKK